MSPRITTTQTTMVAIFFAFATLLMIGSAIAQTEEGIANFYSDKFQGRKTSSGEVYDKGGLTASHKKLAYGTKVKVTNLANNKSVVVTINDRMNQSSKAVIDLTRKAAEEIGMSKSGTAKVKLEVQSAPAAAH
jgi:rare lipoprotein A